MRTIFLIGMLLAAGAAGSTAAGAPVFGSPLPVCRNGFVVISHRGNHVRVPENTVASIKEAVAAGADYVEIDLRTTKDGKLVLSHDATVDRMTDGKGKVRDLSFEEIEKLRVGGGGGTGEVGTSGGAGGSGTGSAAAAGGAGTGGGSETVYRVTAFSEVLRACKGQINIYLDFKDADVAEAYRQIKEAGMEGQIVVYLNKAEDYGRWKRTAPSMPLMGSLPKQITTAAQMRLFLDQADLAVLDNVYDTALQAVAKERGVALWLDVESSDEGPAVWDKALTGYLQGLQTDHPDDLVSFLKKTGRRNGLGAAAGAGAGSANTGKGYTLPPYRKLSDVSYGDDKENVMDAYIPSEYDHAKVIVYIHGGGWTGGDKKEFPASLIEELVGRRKYILVSMNYRLVRDGQNRFPAQIDDVRRLLQFVKKNADRYHYDGDHFALMGGSAGGHLAMLYAYGYDPGREVSTVVDFWGPTDLSDKAVRSGNKDADEKVVNLLGVADPQAQVCLDASPFYKASKATAVPTILFHGEDDPLVDVSQARKMYQKLSELGVPAQLELYPHEKHGVGAAAAIDVFGKTLVWLEKYYPAGPVGTVKPAAEAPGAGVSSGNAVTPGNAGMSRGAGNAVTPVKKDGRTYAERLGWPKGAKVIIFHVDDAGMSVNSNDGAINSIEKGVATSTSIMMPCSWAASFAKYAIEKGYDAGLHLTMTSEWHHYRWPPLAGVKQVPGLVDKEWCLWPEVEDVVKHASADEVEAEIRAQLARALALGLHPTHLDSHMGTLFANGAYLERYIKVGAENGIPVMFPGGNNKLLIANTRQSIIEGLKKSGKWKDGMQVPAVPDVVKEAGVVGEKIWSLGLPVLDDLVTYSGEWKPVMAGGKVSAAEYAKYKVKKFEETIESMEPGVAMYIVHSTVVTDDFRRISGSGDSRNADMLAMMDPELKAFCREKGIILTTWREMMERRRKAGN